MPTDLSPLTYPLPEGSLILLVGPSGSGKTRLSRMFQPSQVLRADDFREMCADDRGDQRVSGAAWQALEIVLRARLDLGLTAVVDATHADEDQRRHFAEVADEYGVVSYAVMMNTPLHVAHARNAARIGTTQVPAHVVDDQAARLRTAAPKAEGIDRVILAETLPALGTALLRLAAEEARTADLADVRRVFGSGATELFDWDTPSHDPQFRTGTFAAGSEWLRVRWMDDADPFGIHFEALVPCPTGGCTGPAWTPVHSMADLSAAHRDAPVDEVTCTSCDT
ncbi:AAA family ATPase [Streptomyces scabiei]|uniref:AAA family ATPase n=1 Tax=Streptomyces scabiei TaxID=1930 RepID=UPI00298FF248|nr:AAA family ATPase [Streptomyces scabiei]MDW8803651.1 AAA family ATPase [Streptomyces scabiei]